MSKRVRKAVFPVAGLGSRFLPATKVVAKEMLPVADRPLIQRAVEEAEEAGIEYFIFVTGRGKSVLMDHFDSTPELEQRLLESGKVKQYHDIRDTMPRPGHLVALRQQEPLGLGHAVWCTRAYVGDEPFAVILPDDLIKGDSPAIGELVEAYNTLGGNVVAVEQVPRERTSSYGILDVEEDTGTWARAKGLVEKPKPDDAPSDLAIIGRYVLDPGVFDYLGRQQKGSGGEIQLTDALAAMIPQTPFHGVRFSGQRFDCGDKVGYLEANLAYALESEDLGERTRQMLTRYL